MQVWAHGAVKHLAADGPVVYQRPACPDTGITCVLRARARCQQERSCSAVGQRYLDRLGVHARCFVGLRLWLVQILARVGFGDAGVRASCRATGVLGSIKNCSGHRLTDLNVIS